MGIGTTGIAALNQNRQFIGIEKDTKGTSNSKGTDWHIIPTYQALKHNQSFDYQYRLLPNCHVASV